MNRDRYPADWDAISLRIRYERAGGFCEWCGAPDKTWIQRRKCNPAAYVISEKGAQETEELFAPILNFLTVHHLGTDKPDGTKGDRHDKMDVREENLAALCNRCHLFADMDIHQAHAKATRYNKKVAKKAAAGEQPLF